MYTHTHTHVRIFTTKRNHFHANQEILPNHIKMPRDNLSRTERTPGISFPVQVLALPKP